MKLLIPLSLALILGCSGNRMKLSESCTDIIASDSFYFALPLDEDSYTAMYKLENYLVQGIDSTLQKIDSDCAVVVKPTSAQIDELKEILGDRFGENLTINERHAEAIVCLVESKGIETLVPTGSFLRFIGRHGVWDLDIRKDTLPDWKIILFKHEKEPVILPGVAVTTEKVEEYFND